MRMGFRDVAALAGGLPAWEQAGGAVERGRPAAAPFGWDAARAAVPRVAPRELDAALHGTHGELAGAALIDVDQSDAYARGHVPGAAWICRSRLEARLGATAPDRSRPVVVTCGDGVASTLAAAT